MTEYDGNFVKFGCVACDDGDEAADGGIRDGNGGGNGGGSKGGGDGGVERQRRVALEAVAALQKINMKNEDISGERNG